MILCEIARIKRVSKINLKTHDYILGPKLIFVTGLVKFVTAVARLVCPDLLR